MVPSRATPRGRRASFLVLASDFQRTLRFRIEPFIQPLFFVEVDCKGTTFFITGNLFFQLFSIKYLIQLITNSI